VWWSRRADLNAKSGPDEATPLHLACRYNSDSATQFVLGKLLAINAKDAINIKDAKGRTPLHYATRRGHDMVIKVHRRSTGLQVELTDGPTPPEIVHCCNFSFSAPFCRHAVCTIKHKMCHYESENSAQFQCQNAPEIAWRPGSTRAHGELTVLPQTN